MKKVVFIEFESLIKTISGENVPKGLWDASINIKMARLIANHQPMYVCILSNQEGIEKGTTNKRDIEFMMEYFLRSTRAVLKELYNINPIIEYSYCPFVTSFFKLPNVGMLDRFIRRYALNIEPSDCIYIGRMKETANNFNCEYIKT